MGTEQSGDDIRICHRLRNSRVIPSEEKSLKSRTKHINA
jgi:hypothetical protein